ncbi:MAG TPA: ABC transporter ATP-binding protein [Mycobacteriales bacterium]|nr:ABC transporter ATP-binding protein [Mycobacteriales bacterium]
MKDQALLEIQDLCVDYRMGKKSTVPVVRDVSLELYPDESVALVGESGCGKTTLALAMLRLLPKLGVVRSGSIRFRKRTGDMIDLLALGESDLRRFRWTEAAMVYQGAQNSLNPLIRIRTQFLETAKAHSRHTSTREIEDRARELLHLVQLEPARVLPAYPHELSGGMRQRVLIALGLLLDPQLVILDEPTTALDILTQRAIVEVLRNLQRQLHFSMLFVSHDLALAAELADRVATMYGGRIVELGGVRETFYDPRHPYTIGLIKAVVPITGDLPGIRSIAGQPPSFGNLPAGCAFHPRCPHAQDICGQEEPPALPIDPTHSARCFFADAMSIDREPATSDV